MNDTLDQSTVDKVRAWLETSGDLFVNLYYAHCGSSGWDYFIERPEHLQAIYASAKSGAIITVLRERQFAIRGVVADSLITLVGSQYQEGEEWSLVDSNCYPAEISLYAGGDTCPELERELRLYLGVQGCIGRTPDYHEIAVSNDDALIIKKL